MGSSQILIFTQVDYQQVADEVGTKYGKNARTAFKKLWEKIKGATNAADTPAGENTGEPAKKEAKDAETTAGEEDGEPPKKKAKVVKKGIARPVAKPSRKKAAKKVIKKEALITHADPDETEQEDEAEDYSQTQGDEHDGLTPGQIYQAMGVRTPPGCFGPA